MEVMEAVIPKYPFEPDPATGNPMFRINRNDSVANYKRTDFLVPHRKDYYFMAFIKQGCSRHWIDMMPYTLKPDTFYFTVPHQVHMKEEAKQMTGISISFNQEFLALADNASIQGLPLIQNPHNGHELILNSQDLAFVEDILEKIYAEYQTRNSWQQAMLAAYMKVLLIHLSRLYAEQFSPTESYPDRLLLKKYLAQIDQSYTQLHEVAAYAERLNLSAGHLSELVKEQSGKPAIAHIHERLILEAKRLLFHTDFAIKEIAFRLGFEDASYFNRFFKRITQHTPVEYRNAVREMYQ